MNLNDIYQGDAYELIKQIPDNSVDLVITDPPYEIVAGGSGGAFGYEKHKYHLEVSKKLNYGIDNTILEELERVMKKTNIYLFCNKNQLLQYLDFYQNKNIDVLVWHKTNTIPTISNKYLSDLEYMVFAREKGTPMFNTHATSSKLFQTPTNRKDKQLYTHPTIKPEFIIERLVKNSSQEGDVILDPFLGSGTTAAVAKKMARKYIGFEIDDDYFQIAKDRLAGITQKDRKVLDAGQTSLF